MSKPAPPVDVRELDALLDGLFSWPVTVGDLIELDGAIRDMWPGARVEATTRNGREVQIVVWWEDYHHGAMIRRTIHQP